MNPEVLKSLENICWFCGTLSAVVAAWFKLRSTWLSKPEDREALQEGYRARWQRLRDGGYLELPERGVRWLLWLKSKVYVAAERLVELLDFLARSDSAAALVLLIPGPIAAWIRFGAVVGLVATVVGLLFGAVLVTERLRDFANRIENLLAILIGLYMISSCVVVLQLALSLEVYWTALVLLVILPLYGLMASAAAFAVTFFGGALEEETAESLGAAIAFSFFVTAVALLVGSMTAPEAEVPQTAQMFLVNVLCDGITLVLTFLILERAIDWTIPEKGTSPSSPAQDLIRRKYPVPVAILLDVSVAAILACLSLYLGLLGTERAITLREAVNVLVALAPSGTTYELGPYFWAMHTTFIPTLMYLTVIVLAYIGKLIVLPVFHVLRKGHELEKPHDLTAAVFAFVAVVFVAIGGLLGRITPDQVIPA